MTTQGSFCQSLKIPVRGELEFKMLSSIFKFSSGLNVSLCSKINLFINKN